MENSTDVTPAEHAATVRKGLALGPLHRECSESLAALVALAERAEKLEIDADAVVGAMKAAEARATELERERDRADADCERVMQKCDQERERAERAERERDQARNAADAHASLRVDAETALRQIATSDTPFGAEHLRQIARAALGETAQ